MVSSHLIALALLPWAITFVPRASARPSSSSGRILARRLVAPPVPPVPVFAVRRSISNRTDPYKVSVEKVPYFRAAPLCAAAGMDLVPVTTTNWKDVVQVEGLGVKAWIQSWNGDAYSGACLLLSNTGISISDSCDTYLPALCQARNSSASTRKSTSKKTSGLKSPGNGTAIVGSSRHLNSTTSHHQNLTHPALHNLTSSSHSHNLTHSSLHRANETRTHLNATSTATHRFNSTTTHHRDVTSPHPNAGVVSTPMNSTTSPHNATLHSSSSSHSNTTLHAAKHNATLAHNATLSASHKNATVAHVHVRNGTVNIKGPHRMSTVHKSTKMGSR